MCAGPPRSRFCRKPRLVPTRITRTERSKLEEAAVFLLEHARQPLAGPGGFPRQRRSRRPRTNRRRRVPRLRTMLMLAPVPLDEPTPNSVILSEHSESGRYTCSPTLQISFHTISSLKFVISTGVHAHFARGSGRRASSAQLQDVSISWSLRTLQAQWRDLHLLRPGHKPPKTAPAPSSPHSPSKPKPPPTSPKSATTSPSSAAGTTAPEEAAHWRRSFSPTRTHHMAHPPHPQRRQPTWSSAHPLRDAPPVDREGVQRPGKTKVIHEGEKASNAFVPRPSRNVHCRAV